MSWSVLFAKLAQKDAPKLASASPALKQKAQALSPGAAFMDRSVFVDYAWRRLSLS